MRIKALHRTGEQRGPTGFGILRRSAESGTVPRPLKAMSVGRQEGPIEVSRKRVLVIAGVIALVIAAGFASFVAGLFVGASYTLARDAQTDALVTASSLTRLRDGRSDEGVAILEGSLESDFVSHFGGFPVDHAAPEVWVFGPLNLSGMAFAATYLNDHPRPERTDFLQSIIDCHLQPDLPDPRDRLVAHRQAIADCYGAIQDTLQ